MPLQKGYSTNLGLPRAPTTNNAELFSELLRLYNACNSLAANLDIQTGALGEPSDVWSQVGVARCTIGKNSVIYLQTAEAIAYGQTVGINAAGKAVLADDAVAICIGFSTSIVTVAINGYVQVQQLGIYPAFAPGTLTPGNRYVQSTSAGAIGATGTGTQIVGYAITDRILYFNPQLQF